MLKLYHSPMSRSTTIIAAILEMGIADKVEVKLTSIKRSDGTGGPDRENPHPDGKVPALDHDGNYVTERPAILTYLSDLFPNAPAIRAAGHPQRGPFLTWFAYYGDVVEPVLVCAAAGIDHPFIRAGFRGCDELASRLVATFSDGREYLLPDGFSTADLLMAAPFIWLNDYLPKDEGVQAWFERVTSRDSIIKAAEQDALDVSKVA